jgi:hypothetical protein
VTRHRHIAALVLGTAALAACGSTAQTDITAPAASARVMFFNEGLGSPGVNFFADSAKLTAISSGSGLPTPVGTTYSQVAAGGDYVGLTAGAHTLTGRLSDTTAANRNVVISSVSTTLANGKWYSYYQSGVYDSVAKKVDAFVVEDPIPATYDYTVANVRFVNAIYNSAPGTLTVTDTTGKATAVGGAVAYKTASAFVAVPPGSYTFSVSGLGASAVTRAAVNLAAGRYYTITARGNMTVASKTATNYPTLDSQANR